MNTIPAAPKYNPNVARGFSGLAPNAAPGWNYNPADFNGPSEIPSWMIGAIGNSLPLLKDQINFATSIEPMRQSSIAKMLKINPQTMVEAFKRRSQARAREIALSPGIDPNSNEGKGRMRQSLNNSVVETGEYDANINSPEALAKFLETQIAAITGAQPSNILTQLLASQQAHAQAMGTEYQKPQDTSFLGQLIGSAAGGWAGGGFKGLKFGK